MSDTLVYRVDRIERDLERRAEQDDVLRLERDVDRKANAADVKRLENSLADVQRSLGRQTFALVGATISFATAAILLAVSLTTSGGPL